MTETSPSKGRVVWRELMTRDVAGAKRFYGELFNWTFEDFPMKSGPAYPMVKRGDKAIAGLVQMEPGMDMPCYWTSYVSVPDVAKVCHEAKTLGATVPFGPEHIPDVGTLAFVLDPEGAAISLMKSDTSDPPVERPAVGEFCWETLSARDPESAKRFYSRVLPWKLSQGAGMDTFGVGDGPENQVADIQKAQGSVPPNWLTYVVVEKLEPSVARAEKLGGKTMLPPMAIPGVGRMAIVQDDQGAALGLFEPGM